MKRHVGWIMTSVMLSGLLIVGIGCGRGIDDGSGNNNSGPALTSISVSPANGANGKINQGYTQQFTAIGTFSDGSTKDLTSKVTWTSSDIAKATIDARGLATSVAQGDATIKATSGSTTGSTTLIVNPPLDACGAISSCKDTDGDGFCDDWEDQNYIDLNGNGVYDKGTDFHFPHADFTLINHTGTGTGVLGLAPTNTSSPVEPADVEITIVSNGSTGVATFNYSINGSAPVGPLATNRSIDLPGNVRLYFSDGNPEPSFVAGDNYTFSSGVNAKIADKDLPNIYVQYDYMVLPDQGTACNTYGDCEEGQYCLENVCQGHSDGPDQAAVDKVVAAFQAQGIKLYIDPVHLILPHSKVISFSPPVDGCAGGAPLTIDKAVYFYDIKSANFAPQRKPVFHYVIFGHLNTCDSPAHCSACVPVWTYRSSGLSEVVGNDLIISLGGRLDIWHGIVPPPQDWVMNHAGTFMHELGHNLGLEHGGPIGMPDYNTNNKPNYLSVMNYLFEFTGIGTAASPGSTIVPPGGYRVDYSRTALAPLNETSLNETIGINSGTNDVTYYYCPMQTPAPGTGAIDWNCNGDFTEDPVPVVGSTPDINSDSAQTTLLGNDDWSHLTYAFQCNAAKYEDPVP